VDRRDRTVAGGLALALAVIVAAMVAPGLLPAGASTTDTSPPPSSTADVYREGMLGRPTSVDPLTARSAVDQALVGLVFSGLLRLGPGDALRPDLARWWRPEQDGAAWLVRLADDATWHDGEPVTADDVAFTFAALADPVLESPQGSSFASVSVEVVDDRTVRFVLAEPLGGFPWLLTQPLAPAHLLETIPLDQLAGDPFEQAPVGSGPYRMVSWDATRAILEAVRPDPLDPAASAVATARPSRPLARLDALEVAFYSDPAKLAADLDGGLIHGAVGLDGADVDPVATGQRLLAYPGTDLTTIVLDQRPDHPEFRDSRTRTGLLAALDVGAIAGAVASGATRADAPIPPSSSLFDAATSVPVAHDAKAATSSLTAAGWKRSKAGAWTAPGASKAYTMTLLAPPETVAPHLVATARAIAGAWTEFGIRTTVEEVPFDELVSRLRAGDFIAAVVDFAIGHDPDLYPILGSTQAVGGGLNVSGIQDPKLDRLLLGARRAVADEQRRTAYVALQDYLAKGRFLLTLYFADTPFRVSDALEGPAPHQVAQAGDRYWDVLTWRLASGR
jgi:peptide/nickel transport system substrate-binding protein